jgi:hypothetical protein
MTGRSEGGKWGYEGGKEEEEEEEEQGQEQVIVF